MPLVIELADEVASSLAECIDALTTTGFAHVECQYKNGIFALYTGQRTAR